MLACSPKQVAALAALTGWGRLFVGSLLVATATSLPELSTNISAVRLATPNPELALGNVLGANMINMFTFAMVALGVGNLYGSCAFNVTILFYSDPFYHQGIVLNQSEPAHFVAGGIAIGLILFGLAMVLVRNRLQTIVAAAALATMAWIYIIGAVVVATLGAPERAPDDATASVQHHEQQPGQ